MVRFNVILKATENLHIGFEEQKQMNVSFGTVLEVEKNIESYEGEYEVTPDPTYTCLSQVTVNAIPYVESANSYGTTVTIG